MCLSSLTAMVYVSLLCSSCLYAILCVPFCSSCLYAQFCVLHCSLSPCFFTTDVPTCRRLRLPDDYRPSTCAACEDEGVECPPEHIDVRVFRCCVCKEAGQPCPPDHTEARVILVVGGDNGWFDQVSIICGLTCGSPTRTEPTAPATHSTHTHRAHSCRDSLHTHARIRTRIIQSCLVPQVRRTAQISKIVHASKDETVIGVYVFDGSTVHTGRPRDALLVHVVLFSHRLAVDVCYFSSVLVIMR